MNTQYLDTDIFKSLLSNTHVCRDQQMEDHNEIPDVTYISEYKGYRMMFEVNNLELSIEELTFKNDYLEDELTDSQITALVVKSQTVLDAWVEKQREDISEAKAERANPYGYRGLTQAMFI